MKSLSHLILALMLIVAPPLFAQDSNEEESSEGANQQPQVEEIAVVKKPPSPFSLSGGLEVQPVGFSDLYGEPGFYLGLSPSLSSSTKFDVAGDRILNASVSYSLGFRSFLESEPNTPKQIDFDNVLVFSGGLDINDYLDLKSTLLLDYIYVRRSKGNEIFALVIDPQVGFKVQPTTRLFLAYRFIYYLFSGSILGFGKLDGGPPSDPGDSFAEAVFPSDTIADSISGVVASDFEDKFFWYANGISAGVSQTFSDRTSGSLKYRFSRWFSNNDDFENYENWVEASLSQKAWKKASTSLRYRLRIRDFVFATADDNVTGKREIRHRVNFGFNQGLTSNLSLSASYMLQYIDANKESPNNGDQHTFTLAAAVSF